MSKYDWQSLDFVDAVEGNIDFESLTKAELIGLVEELIDHNHRTIKEIAEMSAARQRPAFVVNDDEIFPGYVGEPLAYHEVAGIPDEHYGENEDDSDDDIHAYLGDDIELSHELNMHYDAK